MTEVTSSSTSSLPKSDESVRTPGKLGGMVSLFEKKAEEKQQPPILTRPASNSLSTPSPSITPLQHTTSTAAATSAAPRLGASIAERMAAMKGLTMSAPALPTSSSHIVPGKLSAGAKTLPLSFDPSSSSSSTAAGSAVPRPNKLAIGGLGALNAALANGLKAGLVPGGARGPTFSVTKRDESHSRAAESREHDQKEEALLQTAPAAISSDEGAAGDSGAAELTHAKRAKRAGRAKAVSRPGAGTLRFKAFSEVSKAAELTAAVTLVGGEEKKEQSKADDVSTDLPVQRDEPMEVKEQSDFTDEEHAAIVSFAATSSATMTGPTNVPSTLANTIDATQPTAVQQLTAEAPTVQAYLAAAQAVEQPLDTSSASVQSEDSLNSSFSSVASSSASAASLDSSFTGEQLSVYNAAADYFLDPATLGYNPAMHASYSTLLHTGATFHRWQATGSSAKRLLYLSDCTTYLCLVDSKKRLPLDKVEQKRRLPTAALAEVVKGKASEDEVWVRSACKDVLPGRCLMLRCGGEVGDGMMSVMHVEALTGVQRDEWEEALRWLIATKAKGSTDAAQ